MECTWAPHGCGAISVFVCVCDSMTTTSLWLCWINSTHAEKRTQQINNCCRLARKECRPAAPVSSPGHQAITLPKELHDPASVLVGLREDKWDWILSVSPEMPSCERLDRTEHGRVKCRGTELAGGFSSRHPCGVRAVSALHGGEGRRWDASAPTHGQAAPGSCGLPKPHAKNWLVITLFLSLMY